MTYYVIVIQTRNRLVSPLVMIDYEGFRVYSQHCLSWIYAY